MIIQYYVGTPDEEIEQVRRTLREWNFRVQPNPGELGTSPDERIQVDNVFGTVSNGHRQAVAEIECVQQVIPIEGVPQNLALLRRGHRHTVTIPNPRGAPVEIGAGRPLVVMAGVCAVDADHTLSSHQMARRAGPISIAAAPSNPAPPPMTFRGSRRMASRSLPKRGKPLDCPSSRKSSMCGTWTCS